MYNVLFVDVNSLLNTDITMKFSKNNNRKHALMMWFYKYRLAKHFDDEFDTNKVYQIFNALKNNDGKATILCTDEASLIYKFVHDELHKKSVKQVRILNISNHHYCAEINDLQGKHYAHNWMLKARHHFGKESIIQWVCLNNKYLNATKGTIHKDCNVEIGTDINAFGNISDMEWHVIVIYKDYLQFPPHLNFRFNRFFLEPMFKNMKYNKEVFYNDDEKMLQDALPYTKQFCAYRNKRYDLFKNNCPYNCQYCMSKFQQNDKNIIQPPDISVIPSGDTIVIGKYRDAFPYEEEKLRYTYNIIKQCNEKRIHYILRTKSTLFANDEYINIYDKELCHLQVTLDCTDDNRAKIFEPGAAPPSERIKAIEKIEELGFDISIRVSPFDLQFTNVNIINNIKCKKAILEFLSATPVVRKYFNIDYSHYTYCVNSSLFMLPLEEQYELYKMIKDKKVTICLSDGSMLNFWKEKDAQLDFNNCCNIRL